MIPALSHTNDAGGVKKPVRYGTRIRNKQKKEVHQSSESKDEASSVRDNSMPLEEEQGKEAATKGASGVNALNVVFCVMCVTGDVPPEDQVPNSWEGDAASSEEV